MKGKEPPDKWKSDILHAGHSPVRALMFHIRFSCPYFVAMHLVRHKHGVEWYVESQRSDEDRASRKQGELVNVSMVCNAQALMNIAKVRLCEKADVRTQAVVQAIRTEMFTVDPVVAKSMQAQCEYQGIRCREMHPCGKYDR